MNTPILLPPLDVASTAVSLLPPVLVARAGAAASLVAAAASHWAAASDAQQVRTFLSTPVAAPLALEVRHSQQLDSSAALLEAWVVPGGGVPSLRVLVAARHVPSLLAGAPRYALARDEVDMPSSARAWSQRAAALEGEVRCVGVPRACRNGSAAAALPASAGLPFALAEWAQAAYALTGGIVSREPPPAAERTSTSDDTVPLQQQQQPPPTQVGGGSVRRHDADAAVQPPSARSAHHTRGCIIATVLVSAVTPRGPVLADTAMPPDAAHPTIIGVAGLESVLAVGEGGVGTLVATSVVLRILFKDAGATTTAEFPATLMCGAPQPPPATVEGGSNGTLSRWAQLAALVLRRPAPASTCVSIQAAMCTVPVGVSPVMATAALVAAIDAGSAVLVQQQQLLQLQRPRGLGRGDSSELGHHPAVTPGRRGDDEDAAVTVTV